MTEARARKAGYQITRGSYRGTSDDRADRWYIETITGPVDRRGSGYRTRAEALQALDEYLRERATEYGLIAVAAAHSRGIWQRSVESVRNTARVAAHCGAAVIG
jgi:hypothetical protein